MVFAALLKWLASCPSPIEFYSLILLILIYVSYAVASTSTPRSKNSPVSPPHLKNVVAQPNQYSKLTVDTATSPTGKTTTKKLSKGLQDFKDALGESLLNDPLVTDAVLNRMLIAREGKVKDAVKMYKRWLEFRDKYDIDNITGDDVKRLAETNVAYFHGRDKWNRPACVLQPRYYDRKTTSVEEVLKFAIHLVDTGVKLADKYAVESYGEEAEGQICILYDRRGMTRRNFDRRLFTLMRKMVDVVQICYAERLGKIYVIGVNWFFHMMYRIVSPLLSQKTRSKLVILNDPNDILTYFDRSEVESSRLDESIDYEEW